MKVGAVQPMKSGRVNQGRQVLVLDTSAILRGFARQVTAEMKLTTPDVMNELSRRVASSDQLPIMNESSIDVRTPSEMMLRRVGETAAKVGENSLSMTDRSLLALALELKVTGYDPVLITDDYALQNLAETLGLAYRSYTERGIRRRYKWKLVCSGCLREYGFSLTLKVCSVCGTKLRRRIMASKKVGQNRS